MCLPMWAHWRRLANAIEIMHIGAIWQIRLNLCFFWPTQVHNPNGKSIGSVVCVQPTADTLQWATLSPKIPLPMGRSGLSSNTCFPWPIRVLNPNSISIGSTGFAALTSVTDRPTDRPRYSVGNNRPHLRTLRSTAMRPNNNGMYLATPVNTLKSGR